MSKGLNGRAKNRGGVQEKQRGANNAVFLNPDHGSLSFLNGSPFRRPLDRLPRLDPTTPNARQNASETSVRGTWFTEEIGAQEANGWLVNNDNHTVVHVVQHDEGWAVKKTHAERSSGVFDSQAAAIDRAKELAGRGEVVVHGRHGKIRRLTPFE